MKFAPAALVAAALVVTACAPSEEVYPSASPSASAAPTTAATLYDQVDPYPVLETVQWLDNGELAPTIEVTTPFDFTGPGAILVSDGDGAKIEDGQIVSLAYTAVSGVDGSVMFSTYDTGTTEGLLLAAETFDASLYEILVNGHVGLDLLYAIPGSGAGGTIMAVTVTAASDVLARAEGTAVDPVPGLPVVTLDATGKPSVTYPSDVVPGELVSQNLIEGTGAVVADGQSVTVHYTGWVWNGEQFDSSWDRGAASTFTLTTGGLIDGWVQGLVGKTVGSQVLLVVPPALGYGDVEQGTIPAGSTLVFVVDILAAS